MISLYSTMLTETNPRDRENCTVFVAELPERDADFHRAGDDEADNAHCEIILSN